MSITIRCPECHAEGRVKNQRAGTTVKCNMCGQPVKVPADAPRSSRAKGEPKPQGGPKARGVPVAKAAPHLQTGLPEEAFNDDYLTASPSEQVRAGVASYLLDKRIWLLALFFVGFAGVLWGVNWYNAYSDLVEAAEKDRDPVASYQLARFYESGLLADPARAFELYKYAATKNHPAAQFTVGEIYEYGTLAGADRKEAHYWYQRASTHGQPQAFAALERWANNGSVNAQISLGTLCSDSSNTNYDLEDALRWYTMAAEAGSTEALFLVGQRHADGRGTAQDWAVAAEWYERAAAKGEVRAQFALARMYRDGTGVGQDPVAALKYYSQAADNGHVPSAVRAGLMLYEGEEVERNPDQAAGYFNVAVRSKDPERVQAAYYLGGMHFNGDGVPQNVIEADRLFLIAAEAGHARAQFSHAVILANGERGRIPNPLDPHYNEYTTSAYWFRECTRSGGWPDPVVMPADNSEYKFEPEYGLVYRSKKLRRQYPPPGQMLSLGS